MDSQDEPQHHLTSSKTGTLYFAFGSNLSAVQMGLRLRHSESSSVPVALARLDNYEWIICQRGYANVVPTNNTAPTSSSKVTNDISSHTLNTGKPNDAENVVYGILYNMSPEDESSLDRYEGHDDSRNPDPEPNPDINDRVRKPYLQGHWDYNKHYLPLTIIQWFHNPADYGIDATTSDTVRALCYVDEHRTEHGVINAEYIGRMNRGITEAMELGLPGSWVEGVMRRWIPEGVEVDDQGYVGTDRGYVEAEATETLDDVKERVLRGWRVAEGEGREGEFVGGSGEVGER
jgi:gamma-glutamylcyclotransferase